METIAGIRCKPIVLVSSILILALIVLLATVALVTWPTADDYCNRVLVDHGGVVGALRWLFFEWSGRIITGAVLYLTFALVDLPELRWVSVALVGLFALAAFLAASLVSMKDRALHWPLSAFVLAALVVGLYQLLGQSVFWLTGGIVYMVPLVIALCWLLSVRRIMHGTLPGGGMAYGFLPGVLVGNSIELVLPIVICYVALVVPEQWKALSSTARHALVWRVSGVAVGALILVAAPGNYARAQVTPDSFRFEPQYVAAQYLNMLHEIGSKAWPMLVIIGTVAIASLFAVKRVRGIAQHKPSPLREASALAIGALASIIPVLAAPAQFAPRNGIYLLVFAFVAALLPLVACAQHARWCRFTARALVGVAAVGTVIASVPLLADARLSNSFRERLLARDRALKQMPHANQVDATVAPMGFPVPRTLHFVEVDTDHRQWNNVCMAKYYGLRSIALDATGR